MTMDDGQADNPQSLLQRWLNYKYSFWDGLIIRILNYKYSFWDGLIISILYFNDLDVYKT